MTAGTRVLLDVDGVINAYTGRLIKEAPSWGWSPDSFRSRKVEGFTITYSQELIDSLNALAARSDVEVFWLTTWREQAAGALSSELGINGADWTVLNGSAEELRWWKLRHALEQADVHDGKLVWIDDDIRIEGEALSWLEGLMPEDDILTICPLTSLGITRAQWERVERFIGAERKADA